ncbi:MAG: pyridoxal phosphate-dependent aminotransferase [Flavobacteriia bacterium]|jgi:aspartate aminotransferase|nr:pyridoxal phosphate-dependent aminotransferase [Flavobacteriia bacterium]NBP29067.1 pyridoxal phosphate-dependent aminotransferase [Flavobacteriia bacterium]
MIALSDRLNAMEESATLAMARLSRTLRSEGKDIISLSLGEPDFNTPQFIKDAAKQAIDENYTTYTPVAGYDELREKIAHKLLRDNGLTYTKDQIVVSTGAKQSIANAVLSIINPGDEVIIPAPYWVSYIEIVKMAGGIPVVIEATVEEDFKISGEQLEQAITPRTKMFIFSSPCNPTGSVYSYKELESLAKVLERYPHMVALSDEIYEHINFIGAHQSLAQFTAIFDQVITVNGASKAWAMTGWRLGYLAASKSIADACNKIQGQFTSGTNSITQRAAMVAMDADPKILAEMVLTFEKRRDLVLNYLLKIPGIKVNKPTGAFYLFPDVSYYFGASFENYTINNGNDLCMYLLQEANIALVDGSGFGAPKCIRISYATSEELLEKAMQRLTEALAKLRK